MLHNSAGRQGYYGVETPAIPVVQSFIALMMLQLGFTKVNDDDSQGYWLLGAGVVLLTIAMVYLHATRRGRFRVWSRVLGDLELAGNEEILDVGCGRGAVTTLAAARVPTGSVIGVDVWGKAGFLASSRRGTDDQIAKSNAAAEGVADRIRYVVGDIDNLNAEGNSFDVVVSGGGMSRVGSGERRLAAVDEAVRVTRPGGRILIGDVRNTGAFAHRLSELGCEDVRSSTSGWETWYGGPWLPLVLVSARKPLD